MCVFVCVHTCVCVCVCVCTAHRHSTRTSNGERKKKKKEKGRSKGKGGRRDGVESRMRAESESAINQKQKLDRYYECIYKER